MLAPMTTLFHAPLARSCRWQKAARVALALAVGAAGSPALAESPSALTARYDISYLGATVAEAELTVKSDGDGPRELAAHVQPRSVGGLVNALSGGELDASYRAQLAGNAASGLLPRRLQADNGTRRKTYRYTGGGVLAALDVSPASDRDRYSLPSPAVLARGPVLHNGASALVALLAHVARAGDCAKRIPYFDGRRRGDMVSTDRGRDGGSDRLASVRDGPLYLCRVEEREPAQAAGFPDKQIVEADDDALDLAVAVVDGRAVPVQARTQVGAGTARAQLDHFELSVAGELVAAVP